MSKVKEGERVKIVTRPITEQDRTVHMYFEHMQGLTGVVANYYNKDEVAVKIDAESLTGVPKEVHALATKRMQDRFLRDSTEEVRKVLTKEEMAFPANYVLLVREVDLEKV